MDGFTVTTMDEAAKYGDLFITLTGCRDVIRREHFEVMKDGVLLANSGHFDVEIDKTALSDMSEEITERKPNITGYRMKDGRILNLLAEGRLVNLAAGNGHPAEIMDMSFALQALGMEYLAKSGKNLGSRAYIPCPPKRIRGSRESSLSLRESRSTASLPSRRRILRAGSNCAPDFRLPIGNGRGAVRGRETQSLRAITAAPILSE